MLDEAVDEAELLDDPSEASARVALALSRLRQRGSFQRASVQASPAEFQADWRTREVFEDHSGEHGICRRSQSRDRVRPASLRLLNPCALTLGGAPPCSSDTVDRGEYAMSSSAFAKLVRSSPTLSGGLSATVRA